jgi:hypothetical protein
VRGDHSIAELRAMLGGKPAEKEAAPAEKSESAPDSGTDDKTAGKPARGEDGKFQKTSKEDGEESKDDKPAGEDGPQKRINKAVKAQREAERKAEQLQREIEELKKGGTKPEGKKETKAADPDEPKKPKQEDFDTFEEFIDKLTDYKADLRDYHREKKEREKKQAEAQESFKKTWEKKKDTAREKFDDFDEVMETAGDTPISRVMHSIINESEIGPQLGYYLATHPEEAAAIKDMTPYAATKAMAKIEDKLTDSKPAEDKKQAKKELPKPPRNVGGNATPKEPKLDDKDIDIGTFKRIARAHLNRQR